MLTSAAPNPLTELASAISLDPRTHCSPMFTPVLAATHPCSHLPPCVAPSFLHRCTRMDSLPLARAHIRCPVPSHRFGKSTSAVWTTRTRSNTRLLPHPKGFGRPSKASAIPQRPSDPWVTVRLTSAPSGPRGLGQIPGFCRSEQNTRETRNPSLLAIMSGGFLFPRPPLKAALALEKKWHPNTNLEDRFLNAPF